MSLSFLAHNMMHVVIAVLAGILFVISLITYTRNKKTKFLFICGAFLMFSVKETILAINIIALGTDPLMALTHAFDLVILLLFAFGILR